MTLTDTECKQANPKNKTYAIYNVNGLYLEIVSTGSKYWRFSYSFVGKRKRIALGVYPEVSLKDAREKRDELRKILKNGDDPADLRKKTKN